MRRLLLVLALVFALALALAAPTGGVGTYASYAEIDALATQLANGRRVSVRCLSPREADGDPTIVLGAAAYVEGTYDRAGRWRPGRYAVFAPDLCEPLVALARGRDLSEHDVRDLAWSILVLAHESGHLRGHRWSESEALTQRWALRHYRATARLLGASPEATTLLLRYAVSYHRAMDLSYRAVSCRWPTVDAAGALRGCR